METNPVKVTSISVCLGKLFRPLYLPQFINLENYSFIYKVYFYIFGHVASVKYSDV